MWDLKKSFPDLSAINRGFGGSQIADSVQFAERIVIPYEPRAVVFYAGDNDLNSGKAPERVAADFQEFAAKIHAKLPQTKLLFIAIKPCPSRWKNADKQRVANELIRKFCEADSRRQFIDIVPKMLNSEGQPRPELFLKDMLHMNADGYQLWGDVLRPHLKEAN
jgi:lysophospholipase L1-like esterase